MAVNLNVISQFDAKGLERAQHDLDRLAEKTKTTSSKMRAAGGAIAASLAAVGTVVAAFAIAQTGQLEDAQVQLENAFKNSGTSMEAQKGAIDKTIGMMEKYGYTAAQTEGAIARMTTVTGDAKKSIHLMGLAADIAKNRHIDLTSASDLLAKSMAGSTTAAKRMGIQIPDAIAKIKDPAQKSAAMVKLLGDHFKGSADAAAGTFAGKMEAAKAKVSDMAAKVGEKLVPILIKLVDVVMKVSAWLGKHRAVLIAVAIVVGTVVLAAIYSYVAGMVAAAAATIAATWPILLIIGIIALLVLGVIYAWTHWKTFRVVVMAVWHAIQHAVKAAWNDFIKPVFHAIKSYITDVLIPEFKLIWSVVKFVFGVVVDVIKNAWNNIKTVFGWIKDAWNKVTDLWTSAVDTITGIFGSIGDAIWKGIKAGVNTAIGILNGLIHAFNGVTGFISFGTIPHVPDIPKLAQGGPVTAGMPYIVGDGVGGHGGELFVPGQSGSIVPRGKFGGGSVVNHVVINVHGADPQATVNALRTWMQRNGSLAGAGIR